MHVRMLRGARAAYIQSMNHCFDLQAQRHQRLHFQSAKSPILSNRPAFRLRETVPSFGSKFTAVLLFLQRFCALVCLLT